MISSTAVTLLNAPNVFLGERLPFFEDGKFQHQLFVIYEPQE